MEQLISIKGKSKCSRDRVSDSPSSIENRRETGIGAVPGGAAHRWRPGQSGNPSGRPRMGALAHACRTVLEQLVPGDQKGRTYAPRNPRFATTRCGAGVERFVLKCSQVGAKRGNCKSQLTLKAT